MRQRPAAQQANAPCGRVRFENMPPTEQSEVAAYLAGRQIRAGAPSQALQALLLSPQTGYVRQARAMGIVAV